MKTYAEDTHLKSLTDALLMVCHNIYFMEK